MRYYITPSKQKQKDLKRHQFLKNRYFYFFKAKPIKLLKKYERWRKIAKLLKLSKKARQKLEWIIYYETKAKRNASLTARRFGISRKTFYKWYNLFQNGQNFSGLEEKERTPHHKRQREITPLQEQKIIKLRKKYIKRSARKLVFDYQRIYGEKISAWKIQKVIEKYKLYYHPQKNAKIQRERKRAQKKKRITELKQKKISGFLFCLDVIVVYWNGLKRYIFTAIDKYSKIAFFYV